MHSLGKALLLLCLATLISVSLASCNSKLASENISQTTDKELFVWCEEKCGYINREGQFVIEPKFLHESRFSEGRAFVEKVFYLKKMDTLIKQENLSKAI